MNCPHCNKPIDATEMRRLLNVEAGKAKRPRAKGLVRNPKGRKKITSACKPTSR